MPATTTRKTRHLHLLGATGEIRTATYNDQEHIVVPVVALVEGVIWPVNAEAPELVRAETLAKAPMAWNGRPTFVNHPGLAEGTPVFGNDPVVLQTSFGLLFNASTPEQVLAEKKLRFETWLNPVKANTVSAAAKTMLERVQREVVEISIGAAILADDSMGSWEGIPYFGEWLEIYPDHLALLEEGHIGACSIEMGCGTPRVAQVHLVTEKGMRRYVGPTTVLRTALTREVLKEGDDVPAPAPTKTSRQRLQEVLAAETYRLRINTTPEDMSDQDLRRALDDALRAVEPGYMGIMSVYPGDSLVIYDVMPENEWITYRRGYTTDTDGVITLSNDRERVEPVTRWEPVAASAAPCGCGATANPPKGEPTTMTKAERIAALHTKTKIAPAVLETMNEDQLKALESMDVAAPAPATPPAPAAAAPRTEDEPEPEPVTAETYVKNAPPEIRELLEGGLKTARDRKAATIAKIKANKGNRFTETQLNAMSQDQLDNMIALMGEPVAPPVDFGANGALPRAAASADDNAVPPPPDFIAVVRAAQRKNGGASATD